MTSIITKFIEFRKRICQANSTVFEDLSMDTIWSLGFIWINIRQKLTYPTAIEIYVKPGIKGGIYVNVIV